MNHLSQYLVLALPVLLLFWLVSRTRRQQRALAQTQSEVQVGTRVMMTSGVFGEVTALLDDDRIELEIAPGVRTRWVRQAVARLDAPTTPVGPTDTESGPDLRP